MVLNAVAKVGLTEKVRFEQIVERGQSTKLPWVWEGLFGAEKMVPRAEALEVMLAGCWGTRARKRWAEGRVVWDEVGEEVALVDHWRDLACPWNKVGNREKFSAQQWAHLTDIYEDNWPLCCGQIIKGEGRKQKNLLGGYCNNLARNVATWNKGVAMELESHCQILDIFWKRS